MKKKLLTTLLAAVLCTPQVAFAARDGEGMQYTSASEGFYGSIRTVYRSKSGPDFPHKDHGSQIAADGSRLGVRGSLDLGHGLTGLYQYEWSVSGDNGSNTGKTRLSYVGLRGAWGEFVAGSHWENDYNWTSAGTDIASTGSGNFANCCRPANSFQYTSPDINGFQGSFRFSLDGKDKRNGGGTMEVVATTGISVSMAYPTVNVAAAEHKRASENIDEWAVAFKYATHGFTFGGAYEVKPDGRQNPVVSIVEPVTMTVDMAAVTATVAMTDVSGTEDATFWALRGGYGQDNWNVNAWYGEYNTSEVMTRTNSGAEVAPQQDRKIFSLAGDIDLGKFALVGIFETHDNAAAEEDSVFLVNVDYKFTSRSKAYLAYIANDFDSEPNREDEVRLGLRMDF